MAAPGALSLEEKIKKVEEKIEKREEEVEEAKNKVAAAEKKLDKLVEGRSEEEYTNDPKYIRAQEDLDGKKKDLARKEEILLELLKEKNLLRSQGAAGPGPSSAAAGVHERQYHVKWARRTVIVASRPTMAALTGAVEAVWGTLKIRDYVLHHKEQLVAEAALATLATSPQSPVLVVVTGQSFSKYKQSKVELEQLAKDVLGVEIDGTAGPNEDDSTFQSINFQMDDECWDGKTGNDCVAMIAVSMRAALCAMTDVTSHPELSQRAMITPVLTVAILLARAHLKRGVGRDVPQLSPERMLVGTKGWGPVDYVIVYRMLAVVVVEAKRLDMEGAWAQLIMQICSVRELMLASLGVDAKKRKVFQAQELERVVTYAIVCTADTYKLVRFQPGNEAQAPSLVASSSIKLPLCKTVEQGDLEKAISRLVGKIAEIVCEAVDVIDKAKEAQPMLGTIPSGMADLHGEGDALDDGDEHESRGGLA